MSNGRFRQHQAIEAENEVHDQLDPVALAWFLEIVLGLGQCLDDFFVIGIFFMVADEGNCTAFRHHLA